LLQLYPSGVKGHRQNLAGVVLGYRIANNFPVFALKRRDATSPLAALFLCAGHEERDRSALAALGSLNTAATRPSAAAPVAMRCAP